MIVASNGMADMAARDDEMRPVTVLFAGTVGSSSLRERLPPNEANLLIDECMTRLSRVVEQFGGAIQTLPWSPGGGGWYA